MNVKILKLLLTVSVTLAFSGCGDKRPVVVYEPVEVKIPVKCVVPDVHCNFTDGTYTEVVIAQRTCIEELREASKICK